jgi:hypothetical protein
VSCFFKIKIDLLQTENKFWIYKNEEKIYVSNRAIEKYILIVGDYIGVEKTRLEDVSFRQKIFGRLWRILVPDHGRGARDWTLPS